MKIKKVLVAYKRSTYQKYLIEQKDPNYVKLFQKKHPTTNRFLPAHKNHLRSLEMVKSVLKKRKIQFKAQPRSWAFDEKDFDLIVSVGGDGTFLDASRHVLHKTILGINSSPFDSVGRFCSINAEQFDQSLDQLIKNQAKSVVLSRLKVELDHNVLQPVLNDVLICNENPATTSRYLLQIGRKREEQKSSGIWVSTASGSSAAIRGAGGILLPLEDKRFQFLVREPYHQPNQVPTLISEVLTNAQSLVVYSKMREGCLFLDGSRRKEEFRFGSKLKISAKGPKLKSWNLTSV
ncbi:MAG: NAD(+)/NADH kinase [Bdellovibrionales bacterium]|nr:NAD(+)/NADH kinase [Bdellovibrionales bacterium]